jgi:hypothetical protein
MTIKINFAQKNQKNEAELNKNIISNTRRSYC